MGSDDLRSKRKAKNLNSLARKLSKRSSYDRVLIVCEGEKTEPNYFYGLVKHYKINSANIEVDGSCDSSPRKVYQRAIEISEKERAKGNPFDRVYCVFDKDSHSTYAETIANITNKNNFYSAHSVPCFEYWLLLHFTYTTKGYAAVGRKSVADMVIKDLRQHIQGYEKGRKNVFEELVEKLDNAKANAAKSLRASQVNGTENPSTCLHELIEYLESFK